MAQSHPGMPGIPERANAARRAREPNATAEDGVEIKARMQKTCTTSGKPRHSPWNAFQSFHGGTTATSSNDL
ncbi:hypothetical protein [Diaphorobacter caeni]|uniref:hypothetical protein n=1 Tax=Diaphorobacter caeni TaxID=2784387 RepID=UPI00189086D0|nr:hypothetical protein [Diaphorobacter caeni]MBF5006406.1 hypothetical protein [Diaphorobacter caeni]